VTSLVASERKDGEKLANYKDHNDMGQGILDFEFGISDFVLAAVTVWLNQCGYRSSSRNPKSEFPNPKSQCLKIRNQIKSPSFAERALQPNAKSGAYSSGPVQVGP
jgi:hypothetical protein